MSFNLKTKTIEYVFFIKQNGELSAIPFLTCMVAIVVSGIISDLMIRSEKFSKLFVRKLFNTIGFILPIFTFIGLIFMDENHRILAVVLLLINVTFS